MSFCRNAATLWTSMWETNLRSLLNDLLRIILQHEDHNLLTLQALRVESLIPSVGHPGRKRAEKAQRGPPKWAKRHLPQRIKMYGENKNDFCVPFPLVFNYIITDSRNCVIWQIRKLLDIRGDRLGRKKRVQVPDQGKEQACPLLAILGSGSKVWGEDLHLELEELDTQKKRRHPATATFIHSRNLMEEIAGQRANFDVALVTMSWNIPFCKWFWEGNTGWDRKRALSKTLGMGNNVHSLETILFQHKILKYISIQSPL